MQISGAPAWATVGALIALVILLFALLGMAGVIPFTAVWVFGGLAGLAVARLI
jgi:hypothetical protein